MLTNCMITVYNSYTDQKTGTEKYYRTVIGPVSFRKKSGVLHSRGTREDNYYQIRIPYSQCGRYLPPKQWRIADELLRQSRWTLDENDIIVQGIATIHPKNVSELKELYEIVGVVESVVDNRICNVTERLQHLEVIAK